ncbi:hypothetical protein PGTUg99_014934 [Puccinia graminis f. sp. tritici]|uniref:Uncharacterized protein n=1 Tax=Puccinia graminis f. sp. tritici TaxID=56615 RepID=A0A5B0LWM6_PUCGR|nr:hypothetical protein PGTUg99_014934 [Puccinia graminis f. sp. tritici]
MVGNEGPSIAMWIACIWGMTCTLVKPTIDVLEDAYVCLITAGQMKLEPFGKNQQLKLLNSSRTPSL